MFSKKVLSVGSETWKPNKLLEASIETHSWFDIKEYRENFCDQLSKKSEESKTIVIRSQRIQIFPTDDQRIRLLKWLKVSRDTYNATIKYLRTHKNKDFIRIRKQIQKKLKSMSYLLTLKKQCKIPQHTFDNAIKDVIKAYKTAFSNLKHKRIKYFRLRYKKEKAVKQTLVIESSAFYKKQNRFTRVLGKMKSDIPFGKVECDSRLTYNTKTKKFILWIPRNIEVNNKQEKLDICAMDPGIRTFQTCYSPDGICYKIGNNTGSRLMKEQSKIEKVSKFRHSKWYEKFTSRIYRKITNLATDLHWKTAKFLCSNFTTIYIGKLSTKGIVKNNRSKLSKNTKKLTYMLSHYSFLEKLQSKAEEFNTEVKEVSECFTTKTCGKCGKINEKVGAKEIFECDECKYTLDRDIHGARNIYIKNI